MAQVSTYLNFAGNTEEAFNFYKSVFGTEFMGDIVRFGDAPPEEGQPELSDEHKQMVLNVTLPILGGHLLMGTDVPSGSGVEFVEGTFEFVQGNNVHIALHPDRREEADRLFAALSDGGKVEMPMTDMFWGDYYGSFTDKFGTNWMINQSNES